MKRTISWIIFITIIAPFIAIYCYGMLLVIILSIFCTYGAALIIVIPVGIVFFRVFKRIISGLKYIIIDNISIVFIGFYAILLYSIIKSGGDYDDFLRLGWIQFWTGMCVLWGVYGLLKKNNALVLPSANQVLIDYIHQAGTAGMKQSEIIQTLRSNSWTDTDIETAYRTIKN